MSDSVLVVLSCGTDNPNRATRALFFAMVAKKKGKKVAVFLLDEGVYLAKRGIMQHMQAATGDSADDQPDVSAECRTSPCSCARRAPSRARSSRPTSSRVRAWPKGTR